MRLAMRSRSVLVGGFLGGFAGAIALALVGCPASVPDVCSDGCGSDGASQDGPIVPPGCDLTKDPKDSIACVDDSIGLFVSAAGSDSNAGTKESPLKTIGAALSKTSSQHGRVYVCDGTYAEHVKITSTASIYGGFSCLDWSYDGKQGKVAPTDTGYALDVEGVSSAITIEDLEFDATDGQKAGDSSIAIFVANSTGATLRRVKATAGNGLPGADASSTSNYDGGTAPSGNGASADTGGDPCVNHCADGTTSTGGGGGTGAQTPSTPSGGGDGGPEIPPGPLPADNGLGGTFSGSCTTGSGSPGASATPIDGGSPGSSAPGHLSASGWTSIQGASGAAGRPGQGGGGGAGGQHAAAMLVGGGGGGGCGGCGGAGGAAGSSGGSSFGILIFQSTVAIDTCVATSGNAGDGKAGGAGQTGQLGGLKGSAVATVGTGCDGAPGGAGGAGAGGGGGAGGNSIAIGYVGSKPTVTAGSQQEGTAGGPGAGGAGAAANNGLAGAAGTKADVQELP
jgi:hypothetical protein